MSRFIRRKKFCRFTADNVESIDYKDLGILKGYISVKRQNFLRRMKRDM